MRVLVIEPEQKPYVKEISEGLDSLQREVDGYIQSIYPWNEPCAIICDDEAKLKGKPLNRALRDEDNQIYDICKSQYKNAQKSEYKNVQVSDIYSSCCASKKAFFSLRRYDGPLMETISE